MTTLMQLLVFPALVGSALMAGVFFTFSAFVMQALAKLPAGEGIRAMRTINQVILNPWFLSSFLGTALLSACIGLFSILGNQARGSIWFLLAAALYFFGTFLITGIKNVPMNNQLESIDDRNAKDYWRHYLKKWTAFNHIRTVTSLVAVLFYAVGLSLI